MGKHDCGSVSNMVLYAISAYLCYVNPFALEDTRPSVFLIDTLLNLLYALYIAILVNRFRVIFYLAAVILIRSSLSRCEQSYYSNRHMPFGAVRKVGRLQN